MKIPDVLNPLLWVYPIFAKILNDYMLSSIYLIFQTRLRQAIYNNLKCSQPNKVLLKLNNTIRRIKRKNNYRM